MPDYRRPGTSGEQAAEGLRLERSRRIVQYGAEPTSRPPPADTMWPLGNDPVQGRPGGGSPHFEPPPARKASNATVMGVWGIIAAFIAAMTAGFVANQALSDRITRADFATDKREREAYQASVRETLTGIRVDIATLTATIRSMNEPKPIAPDPKKKQQAHP